MDQNIFDQFFHSSLPVVAREAIREEWQSIKPPYDINARRLPLPVWARRGLTDNGEQAWSTLNSELSQPNETKAYCIYIHIPFCADKCAFCDCYSFRLSHQHRAKQIDIYLTALEQEMYLWSRMRSLAQRPISTVHLGGGTPTFLGVEAFQRLVQSCRQYFNISPQTEWALETTSSELDESIFSMLGSLGFTRLHLGVQSLDDPIRRLINRREPAEAVLAKLANAISLGWVTSVDLIYGLPAQSLESMLKDINTLSNIGVHGFSLYELQRSPRNKQFIERNGLTNRDRLFDYFFLQGASQVLNSLGYQKRLFNHFALEEDKNLYFTFPERDEDCLALGTIADGVFNGYHYRHPEYASYCKSVSKTFPGLVGGVRNNARESYLASLETAILSGELSTTHFMQVLGQERAKQLFQQWFESALIANSHDDAGKLRLTTNGSWFAGEMMANLTEKLPLVTNRS